MVRVIAAALVLSACAGAQFPPPPPPPTAFDIQIVADANGWQASGTYSGGPFVVCGLMHLTRDAPWPLGAELELQTVEIDLPGDPLSAGLSVQFPAGVSGTWTSAIEPGTYYATLQGLLFIGTSCSGVPLPPFVAASPAFTVPAAEVDPRPVWFWRRYPQAWPVTTLTIGDQVLDQPVLQELLRRRPRRWTTRLARELIAAHLNLAAGTDPAILPAIEDANALLAHTGPYGRGSRCERRSARALTRELRRYNRGPRRRRCRRR